MVYREGLQSGARKQLGFAFKDISEHLPGAFIIYRADKEDDELIFANDEFLHMSGYKDIDELFRLTEKSFRNLIREDEQQQIESSIWEQIDNGNENDYIHFHLRKADGTYFSVLDHGRIVESPQYGKVFYVLFMDWEDMHIRYNDKLQDKILQKTERMIYFHIMFMSASSIKRKSTLLLREATRSFIFRSATTFPGRKHLRENAFLGFRFESVIRK